MRKEQEVSTQYICLSQLSLECQDFEFNEIYHITREHEIECEGPLYQNGRRIMKIIDSEVDIQIVLILLDDERQAFYLWVKKKENWVRRFQIKNTWKCNLWDLMFFVDKKIISLKIDSFVKEQFEPTNIQTQFFVSKNFINNSYSFPKNYNHVRKQPGLLSFLNIIKNLAKIKVEPAPVPKIHPFDSELRATDIKPLIDEVNFQIKEQTKILPLNVEENDETGLFFDLSEQKIDPTETPLGFKGELKEYQKLALTWMLYREETIKQISMSGLYDNTNWENMKQTHGIKENLYVNYFDQKISFEIPEKKCRGGILADEMGLGKTIMMISLILHQRNLKKKRQNTLIIGPISILNQWESEIKKFAPTLSVFIYHNKSKAKIENLQQFDIIITSKDVIRYEKKVIDERKQYKVNIFGVDWTRIIIDEAHNFKNSQTKLSLAACDLSSTFRWCLTGTPAQNSLTDIYSLLKFLEFQPWCQKDVWKRNFPQKIEYVQKFHYKKIKQILKGIMIRRKKKSKAMNGVSLLNLPKANIQIHLVEMGKRAQKLHQIYMSKAESKLQRFEEIENNQNYYQMNKVQKKFHNQIKRRIFLGILGVISKLRQICCHQFLQNYRSSFIVHENFDTQYRKFIGKKKIKRIPKYNFFQYYLANEQEKKKLKTPTTQLHYVYENWRDKIADIKNRKRFICPICEDEVEDGVITPCTHIFCRLCVEDNIKNQVDERRKEQEQWRYHNQIKQKLKHKKYELEQANCPECGQFLMIAELFHLPVLNAFNQQMEHFEYNEKVTSLLSYLYKMEENDKAIIYTSFLGMVAILEEVFKKQKLHYLTMKGSDSLEERSQKIEEFSRNPRLKIFVITLGTGAVGLNLQAANKIFFMDPWWNPAIQEQAISRVHRLGQERDVQVVKFITKSSIEAKIMKLGLKKKQLADSILDIDDIDNDTRYTKKKDEVYFLLGINEGQRQEINHRYAEQFDF